MIIGHFAYSNIDAGRSYADEDENTDSYAGAIYCLGTGYRHVVFEPVSGKGKGPHFQVLATPPGSAKPCDLGAAWKRISDKGNEYVSVKLDSPFLPEPINCALIQQGDDYVLVWNRKKPAEVLAEAEMESAA